MKILSLFDGISIGRLACDDAKIPIQEYNAYEIDKKAIEISQKNYSDILCYGSVVEADFTKHEGCSLLLAGFPCQDLSINKSNRQGLNGSRSGLFWELVRAIKEVKPKYFLVENNWKMPKEDEETITRELGVEPILINSSSFTAQNRQRLYWTNIPIDVTQIPEDSGFCVENILYYPVRNEKNLISEVTFNSRMFEKRYIPKPYKVGQIGNGGQGERVYSIYGKSVTLTANGGGRGAKTGLYYIDGETIVRKLTPIEAERLQGLPDNYTLINDIGNGARLKAIGNGWTMPVISFILSFIPEVDRFDY